MNTAVVLSKTDSGTKLIRSDTAAAKVMQQAIKGGRGAEVLPDRPERKRSRPVGRIGQIRKQVDDVAQALDDLRVVFEDIGDVPLLVMQSNSATALAFAANVLREVDADRNWFPDAEKPELVADRTYELRLGQADLSVRLGVEELELQRSGHVLAVVKDVAMLRDGANAIWDGDDLSLDFANRERLVVKNARGAGSITLAAGDTTIVLCHPKTPIGEGLLDFAV